MLDISPVCFVKCNVCSGRKSTLCKVCVINEVRKSDFKGTSADDNKTARFPLLFSKKKTKKLAVNVACLSELVKCSKLC